MRYIKRVGPSNNRVTQGRVYELNNPGYIKDDNGANMRPSDNSDYWIPHSFNEIDASKIVAATITMESLQMSQLTTKRKLSTIEITTATYINGENASSYTNDDLVEAIQSEQEKINTLKNLPEKVREQSAAIKALIEKHETNIAKLVEIIDANHKYH